MRAHCRGTVIPTPVPAREQYEQNARNGLKTQYLRKLVRLCPVAYAASVPVLVSQCLQGTDWQQQAQN
jgi:hypothetical protein